MFQMAGWSRDSRENCEGTGAGQLVVGLRTIFTISALFRHYRHCGILDWKICSTGVISWIIRRMNCRKIKARHPWGSYCNKNDMHLGKSVSSTWREMGRFHSYWETGVFLNCHFYFLPVWGSMVLTKVNEHLNRGAFQSLTLLFGMFC